MKTAVEFFNDGLDKILELYPTEWIEIQKLFYQAKQIEKEQIEKAYMCDISNVTDIKLREKWREIFKKHAEQYYNETYKNFE